MVPYSIICYDAVVKRDKCVIPAEAGMTKKVFCDSPII